MGLVSYFLSIGLNWERALISESLIGRHRYMKYSVVAASILVVLSGTASSAFAHDVNSREAHDGKKAFGGYAGYSRAVDHIGEAAVDHAVREALGRDHGDGRYTATEHNVSERMAAVGEIRDAIDEMDMNHTSTTRLQKALDRMAGTGGAHDARTIAEIAQAQQALEQAKYNAKAKKDRLAHSAAIEAALAGTPVPNTYDTPQPQPEQPKQQAASYAVPQLKTDVVAPQPMVAPKTLAELGQAPIAHPVAHPYESPRPVEHATPHIAPQLKADVVAPQPMVAPKTLAELGQAPIAHPVAHPYESPRPVEHATPHIAPQLKADVVAPQPMVAPKTLAELGQAPIAHPVAHPYESPRPVEHATPHIAPQLKADVVAPQPMVAPKTLAELGQAPIAHPVAHPYESPRPVEHATPHIAPQLKADVVAPQPMVAPKTLAELGQAPIAHPVAHPYESPRPVQYAVPHIAPHLEVKVLPEPPHAMFGARSPVPAQQPVATYNTVEGINHATAINGVIQKTPNLAPQAVPTLAPQAVPHMVPQAVPHMVPHQEVKVLPEAPHLVFGGRAQAPMPKPHATYNVVEGINHATAINGVIQKTPNLAPHAVPTLAPQAVPHMVPQAVPHMVPHQEVKVLPEGPHLVFGGRAQAPMPKPHATYNVVEGINHATAINGVIQKTPNLAPHAVPTLAPQAVPHMVPQAVPHMVPHQEVKVLPEAPHLVFGGRAQAPMPKPHATYNVVEGINHATAINGVIQKTPNLAPANVTMSYSGHRAPVHTATENDHHSDHNAIFVPTAQSVRG
ncbi:hypothetical protein NMD14_11445 [Aeromonas veronii]